MSLFCDDPGTPPPTVWERVIGIAVALAVNSPLIVLCFLAAREAFR